MTSRQSSKCSDAGKQQAESLTKHLPDKVCQISPVPPKQLTLADLVRLLENLPRPDDAYFDDVEKATRNEPTIPESRWE